MSQNYKIVERLDKVADAAMYTEDSPYQGDSPFGEQIRQAASLIKELGEALEPFAEAWAIAVKHQVPMTLGELGALASHHTSGPQFRKAAMILSKLKEA